MSKQDRILLLTLATINFVNIMDFMIMMPLGPFLLEDFNIDAAKFGLLVSAYSVSAFLSGIITTFIINKFEHKDYLMKVFIGFLLGTFACGFAFSFETLLAARFFTGLFGGVMGAIILTIVSDNIPLERRGQAMGYIMSGFSVASVAGVPFGIYIATHTQFGWHAPFLFLAILGVPVYFLISRFVPKQSHAARNHNAQMDIWLNVKAIFNSRNNFLALAIGVVLLMGHFSIIPFLSPYMTANVGLPKEQLPLIYLVGGGVTIFTSPLVGRAADRFGKFRVFLIFVLLYLIPVYLVTNMPKGASLFHILSVAAIFFIFSSGRFIPSQAMVTGAIEPKIRGSFMSFNSSIQQLANGIASFLAGLIVTTDPLTHQLSNYELVGYFSIGMALLSLFIGSQLRTADGKKF